jgi:oligopeptide transport system substrate-binding protein
MQRRILFLAVLIVTALPLLAAEAEDELVVSLLPTDLELNPIKSFTSTEGQIFTGLYEGLVSYHPLTLDPIPAAAGRWDVGPGGRVYRFFLRQDARYWNGDRVTAEHFRDTWFAHIEPDSESSYGFLFDVIEGAREYRTGEIDDREEVGIVAESESVLLVRLDEPATHFLDILCHHSFVPVHPRMRQVDDWSEMDTVLGNGPYYITERNDEEMELTKNQVYWDRENVGIPRIRFTFRDDYEGVTRDFNDGLIDWVMSGMSLGDVTRPFGVSINPMFATSYFYFNTDSLPGSDTMVRRALANLVPWEKVRSSEIYFTPAQTLVPEIPNYPEVETISEQQRDQAMTLLEDAGYPEGRGLPDITITIPDTEDNRRIAGLFQEAWETTLDLQVTIDAVGYDRYFDYVKTADYDLATLSWIGDFADPLTFLQMWTADSNLNNAGFDSARFDELVDRAATEADNRRNATLAEAEEILLSTGVVLPVSHSPAINLIDLEDIGGWHANPLDVHPFKHLRFRAADPVPGVAQRN